MTVARDTVRFSPSQFGFTLTGYRENRRCHNEAFEVLITVVVTKGPGRDDDEGSIEKLLEKVRQHDHLATDVCEEGDTKEDKDQPNASPPTLEPAGCSAIPTTTGQYRQIEASAR